MSSFRIKLNNLINSIYENQTDVHCSTDRCITSPSLNQSIRSSVRKSQITPSNTNSAKKPQIQTSSVSNGNLSQSQSTFKRQNILNDSTFSPYTERPSFSPFTHHSTRLRSRNNSANRSQSRITNEISSLSKSFREGIVQKIHINRPVVALNKPEYNDFNINYITSIAKIKERHAGKGSKAKAKGKERRNMFVKYPEMPLGMGVIAKGLGNQQNHGEDVNAFAMHFRRKNADGNKLNKLYEAMITSRNKY